MSVRIQFSVAGLLSKATKDTEEPTPGYMFNEINQLSFQSVDACREIESYVTRRLDKDAPNVKLKTLRVIKHLVEKGNPAFRRSIKANTEAIRRCLQYRGTPHPIHGETPYRLVRELAQVVVNLIFDTEFADSTVPAPRMDGFGSDGTSSFRSEPNQGVYSAPTVPGAASGGPSGGRYMGFGNPAFEGHKKETKMDRFKDGVKVKLGIAHHKRSSDGMLSPSGTYSPHYPTYGGEFGNPGGAPPPGLYASPMESAPHHSPGKPGGGWDVSGGSPGGRPAATGPGEYEAKLVDEMTAPGGIRAAPTREALVSFVSKCMSLDGTVLSELLEDKLSASHWHSKLRALYVIEELIKARIHGVEDFFKENRELIEEQTESVQVSIRGKAKKVLRLLGGDVAGGGNDIEEPEVHRTSGGQVSGGQVSGRGVRQHDLLGGLEEEEEGAEEPAEAKPQPDRQDPLHLPSIYNEPSNLFKNEASDMDSMFSGLNVRDTQAETSPPVPVRTSVERRSRGGSMDAEQLLQLRPIPDSGLGRPRVLSTDSLGELAARHRSISRDSIGGDGTFDPLSQAALQHRPALSTTPTTVPFIPVYPGYPPWMAAGKPTPMYPGMYPAMPMYPPGMAMNPAALPPGSMSGAVREASSRPAVDLTPMASGSNPAFTFVDDKKADVFDFVAQAIEDNKKK